MAVISGIASDDDVLLTAKNCYIRLSIATAFSAEVL